MPAMHQAMRIAAVFGLLVGCKTDGGGGSTQPEPKMCTQEAKICPDGSAVGRTGPNCEFAECPGATGPGSETPPGETPPGEVGDTPPGGAPPAKACTREAKMCPDGSAVGRTGPNCEFAPCPGGGAAK